MKNEFYVLKEEGTYYPMAFITLADAAGEFRKDAYAKKLDDGMSIVKVRLVEIEAGGGDTD